MRKADRNPAFKWIFFFAFILLVSSTPLLTGQTQGKVQPLRYSHKKHAGELEIGCQDCHVNVTSQARASIPNIDMCGMCHSGGENDEAATADEKAGSDGDQAEERKVERYVARGQAIPWQQVYNVPDYVYFSHRRHVTLGRVECSTCHGPVVEMTAPFSRPYQPVSMEWCIECHEQKGVSNDCYSCHR